MCISLQPSQNLSGVQYQVTQPLNGDVATIRGVQVARRIS
jgi:hypothetical protein